MHALDVELKKNPPHMNLTLPLQKGFDHVLIPEGVIGAALVVGS